MKADRIVIVDRAFDWREAGEQRRMEFRLRLRSELAARMKPENTRRQIIVELDFAGAEIVFCQGPEARSGLAPDAPHQVTHEGGLGGIVGRWRWRTRRPRLTLPVFAL